MLKRKKPLCAALALFLALLMLSGCGGESTESTGAPSVSAEPTESTTAPSVSEDSTDSQENPGKLPVERAPQIKEQDTYTDLETASQGFDPSIITQELIDNVDLPEATVSDIPYWTGFTLENKILTCAGSDGRWSALPYGPDSVQYWYEWQIALIAQEGFNCARCCYALSYLGSPDDPLAISENALAELDNLLAWGLKYNVHIMLSITGNPDKGYTSAEEENVGSSGIIQTDPYYQNLYQRYMVMLASRYRKIPTKAFSIELLGEPACIDWDGRFDYYSQALLPVIEKIHEIDPDRILIAQDVALELCEELAAAGCALSIHPHLHLYNETRLRTEFGFAGSIEYPTTFLPKYWFDYNGTLRFRKDSGFDNCTLKIHYEYYVSGISVSADGTEVYADPLDDLSGMPENGPGVKEIVIPDGTTEISVRPLGPGFVCIGIEMFHGDECAVFPVGVNREARDYSYESEFALPTITLDEDYKVLYNDPYGAEYTSEMFYENLVAYGERIAEKYGVGFLLTEICGDNDYPLEKYLAFEELETGYLREHKIPWMWNCFENVIGPEARIWPAQIQHRLRETQYQDVYIDDAVMDYIKSLQ